MNKMVQEVIKNDNTIPQDSWVNKQTEKSWKELLEWVELFRKVEELANRLELQKDTNLSIPWLIWYYLLLDWKKSSLFFL